MHIQIQIKEKYKDKYKQHYIGHCIAQPTLVIFLCVPLPLFFFCEGKCGWLWIWFWYDDFAKMIRNAVFTCASALLIGLKAAEGLLKEEEAACQKSPQISFWTFSGPIHKSGLGFQKNALILHSYLLQGHTLVSLFVSFHVFAGKIEWRKTENNLLRSGKSLQMWYIM